MKTYLMCAVISASILLGPEPSYAQDGSRVEQAFKRIDTNNDGTISLDEWLAAGRKESGFKMIDTDGGGKISLDELQAIIAKVRNR